MGRFRERLKPDREKPSSRSELVNAKTLEKAASKKVSAEDMQKAARGYAEDAMKALGSIVRDTKASPVAKISASQTILDRAYGRPTQTNINTTVNSDDKPSQITDQELERRLQAALRAAEDITGSARPQRRKREKIKDEERPADLRKLH